jgi:arylsulfatase A-like enzyme
MTGGTAARWIDEDMADVITSKAEAFLEKHQAEPFFLFFSTHDIHVPRMPHSRFAGKSGLGYRGDAMLQLDWCVGQLLAKLDELQLTENTLVIFSSDNGPVLDDGYRDEANEKLGNHDPNGSLRGGKYSMFEGGTRVPLLLRWPGHVAPQTTNHALVGQIDLAASLAALVGATVPPDACPDSRDSLAALLGKSDQGRPHLIHEANSLALRAGQWKYVPKGETREGLGPWMSAKIKEPGALYDLSQTNDEGVDVAKENPEQLERMQRLREKILAGPDQAQTIGQ